MLAEQHEEQPDPEQVRATMSHDEDLVRVVHRAWPILEATDVLADLYEVPAYLRRCAPGLTPEQVRLLRRERSAAWTHADLPLLGAARHRLGGPGADARRGRPEAARPGAAQGVSPMAVHCL